MREPLEMITASRMQNIVQIRKKSTYFVTKLFFGSFGKSSFGALGVESPHGRAIYSILTKNDQKQIIGNESKIYERMNIK